MEPTVVASTFFTPGGVSTPSKFDSALDAFFGSESCFNIHTTSSAVIGLPSWNLTPWRSLKVHRCRRCPTSSSCQLGLSLSVESLSKIRNSPVWPSILSPPASATVSGLTAAAGAEMATRSVPPFVAAPPLALEELDEPDDDDELPHADRTAPSRVADIPIVLPRRTTRASRSGRRRTHRCNGSRPRYAPRVVGRAHCGACSSTYLSFGVNRPCEPGAPAPAQRATGR